MGRVVVRKKLRRSEVIAFFSKLAPSLVGIEACGSAHYWGRELAALGHEIRLMPAAYVKPYVRRGKNDAVDAEAICEAVTRPTMRFVAVKSADQQSILMLHRTRDLLVRQRTMLINSQRGQMAEFGLVVPQGVSKIKELAELINSTPPALLPDTAKVCAGNFCGRSASCSRKSVPSNARYWLATDRARSARGWRRYRESASSRPRPSQLRYPTPRCSNPAGISPLG